MNLQRKNDKWKKENVISEYFRYSNSGEIDDIKAQKKSRRFYIDCTAKKLLPGIIPVFAQNVRWSANDLGNKQYNSRYFCLSWNPTVFCPIFH